MNTNKTIIVIEDDPDDQQILRDVFRELKVLNEIVFFADCDSAYGYLMSSSTNPFLIICDINLPRMNGVQLKEKIDATDFLRKKSIPFVFLTTSDEQTTVDTAYRITNLQGYFKKGNTMQEIKRRVNCILEYWFEAVHPYNK